MKRKPTPENSDWNILFVIRVKRALVCASSGSGG
jgi:hypothetical protein